MSATLNNIPASQAAILGRTLLPPGAEMPLERARFLVDLHFAEQDIARMNELAAKARAGELTAEEERELDDYRGAGHLLETLKSQARRRLREPEM